MITYIKSLLSGEYGIFIKIGIACCILISLILFNPIYLVGAGEQLVVFNKFTSDISIKETGVRFIFPMINNVKKYSVRVTKTDFNGIEGLSADSQTLLLNIVVNWKLDGTKLRDIYKNIQGPVEDTIMYNAVIDSSKSELGKFGIGDIAKNRDKLRIAIQDELTKRLSPNGVMINNISITNVDFNENYEKAIEQKMIAEQQALEAKNLKQKAQYESEAKAIENRNLSQTITPLVLKQKWIEKWDGKLPQTITGQGTDMILNIQRSE